VQLAGHDFLKKLGIALIPATAPEFFTEDTPTAVLVRQVLGAIAQFEKASLVAKLKAARDRKKAATGKTMMTRTPLPAIRSSMAEKPGRSVSARAAKRMPSVIRPWSQPQRRCRHNGRGCPCARSRRS